MKARPSYPFGPAALVLMVLAIISGIAIALTPPPKKNATLTFWTFAKPHYESYLKAVPAFEKAHPGVTVDLQLVANNGLAQRLQAAFQADLDVPDICEIEISSAGSFFRGPVKNIGFVDLTDRLKSEGLLDRMVESRFSPYTSRGRIFGLPHDVHPVMFAYRRDIMEKAGIDVNSIKTWDDFIRVGQKLTIPQKRYMLEMSSTGTDQLEAFLFQRDGGYFDAQGNLIFDNDVAAKTLQWYVPLVAKNSKTRIGNTLASSYGSVIAQGMLNDYFVCLVAPDWRTKGMEMDIAGIGGKMALMPLPAAVPGGRRTSTWGGTMLGITKHGQHQDLAWEFAKHLYLNDKDLAARFEGTNILPPVRSAWQEAPFKERRPYWSGQALGEKYAALAPDVPAQYSSPFISQAKSKLGEALIASVQYYERNGENGFDAFVRKTLKDRANEVRRQIARNPY
ncbi:MAG: extracellular solute-binding protein [Armatimonadota bacterium]